MRVEQVEAVEEVVAVAEEVAEAVEKAAVELEVAAEVEAWSVSSLRLPLCFTTSATILSSTLPSVSMPYACAPSGSNSELPARAYHCASTCRAYHCQHAYITVPERAYHCQNPFTRYPYAHDCPAHSTATAPRMPPRVPQAGLIGSFGSSWTGLTLSFMHRRHRAPVLGCSLRPGWKSDNMCAARHLPDHDPNADASPARSCPHPLSFPILIARPPHMYMPAVLTTCLIWQVHTVHTRGATWRPPRHQPVPARDDPTMPRGGAHVTPDCMEN